MKMYDLISSAQKALKILNLSWLYSIVARMVLNTTEMHHVDYNPTELMYK